MRNRALWRRLTSVGRIWLAVGLTLAGCSDAVLPPSVAPATPPAPSSVPSASTLPTPGPTPSPTASPAPTPVALLTLSASGLKPCYPMPDYSCSYGVELTGPDGASHVGWFGPVMSDSPTASSHVNGDVPTALVPGNWSVAFEIRRGSDIPRQTVDSAGQPTFAFFAELGGRCARTIEVTNQSAIEIAVVFTHDSNTWTGSCEINLTEPSR